MKFPRTLTGLLLTAAVCLLPPAQAQSLPYTEELIERYSDILVSTPTAAQEQPLKALLQEALTYRDANATNAEAWIAAARIRMGYANVQDGITNKLASAKEVKNELEKAIAINPAAQEGRAQAVLGFLYVTVPGWPLSFGDSKKGATLLKQAIAINATNAANGYYYAQYLLSEKQPKEAQDYLLKAKAALEADTAHPKWQLFQTRNIENLLKKMAK